MISSRHYFTFVINIISHMIMSYDIINVNVTRYQPELQITDIKKNY
jgi:hypothetical protein